MVVTKKNSPVVIDLMTYINNNGWTFENGTLVHKKCNIGTIINKDVYTKNTTYNLTIDISSISGGSLTLDFGSFTRTFTTTGLKEVVMSSATDNPQIKLTSSADLVVKVIAIVEQSGVVNVESKENVVYSFSAEKWTRFDNYYPDFGMSMLTDLYSYKDGRMYSHTDKQNRNNFYGTKYDSRVKFQMVQPKVVTYQNIKLEGTKLLITTTDGVETSLGQVSDLVKEDFEQYLLDDGVTQVEVYDIEGNYTANFLRAKPDINFGEFLKGRFITIELSTQGEDKDFKLYKVVLQYNISTPRE